MYFSLPCLFCDFVSTELANTMNMGEGSYITLFHRMTSLRFTEWSRGWGRGCYITLFSPSDLYAFHRIGCRMQINHKIARSGDHGVTKYDQTEPTTRPNNTCNTIGTSPAKTTLNQCCVNVGPPSATLGQHQPSIGSTSRVCWVNLCCVDCQIKMKQLNSPCSPKY